MYCTYTYNNYIKKKSKKKKKEYINTYGREELKGMATRGRDGR